MLNVRGVVCDVCRVCPGFYNALRHTWGTEHKSMSDGLFFRIQVCVTEVGVVMHLTCPKLPTTDQATHATRERTYALHPPLRALALARLLDAFARPLLVDAAILTWDSTRARPPASASR